MGLEGDGAEDRGEGGDVVWGYRVEEVWGVLRGGVQEQEEEVGEEEEMILDEKIKYEWNLFVTME